MAGDKLNVPIASGGQLATNPIFTGNKTIGRIKSMQCSREDVDPSDSKAAARQRLNEQQQRYADHATGKAPLPPRESLALRTDIDRLSQIVSPGSQNMWGDYSAGEKAYLAQQAEDKRRFANDIGMMAGGPVFAGLPAAARLLGAPEDVVENFGTINADLAGAGVLGGRGRVIEPVMARRPATTLRYMPKSASPGNGLYVARLATRVSTKPNTSHFWSGRSTDAQGQKVGGADRAAQIAKQNNGTTLETLIEERDIKMPDWDPNNPTAIKAWEDISAEYASGVSGEVRAVIGEELRPGNIWQTKELPALLKNPNVTKIITIDPVTGLTTVIFP